mmetsp:Transcript_32767/g.74598  ORF Transcript_32767/g.74598 Transcript_32767/m.74598 type:complete len:81 (-) Transcript_32767:440-682(-)
MGMDLTMVGRDLTSSSCVKQMGVHLIRGSCTKQMGMYPTTMIGMMGMDLTKMRNYTQRMGMDLSMGSSMKQMGSSRRTSG